MHSFIHSPTVSLIIISIQITKCSGFCTYIVHFSIITPPRFSPSLHTQTHKEKRRRKYYRFNDIVPYLFTQASSSDYLLSSPSFVPSFLLTSPCHLQSFSARYLSDILFPSLSLSLSAYSMCPSPLPPFQYKTSPFQPYSAM